MDIYTTSSSSASPTASNSGDAGGLVGSSSVESSAAADLQPGQTEFQRDWTDGRGQQSWLNRNQLQPSTSGVFDLATSGDSSPSGSIGQRTRERSTLGQQSRQQATISSPLNTKPSDLTVPSVPTSTTTSAPEYVMINPTGNGDQDE